MGRECASLLGPDVGKREETRILTPLRYPVDGVCYAAAAATAARAEIGATASAIAFNVTPWPSVGPDIIP